MARTRPFDENADYYDNWYERHDFAYRSELAAVRVLLPEFERAVEVGIGTGRFAEPFGIRFGVEPSAAMAEIARSRGIRVLIGAAEELPLESSEFDLVTMMTTVAFLDDMERAFGEASRVLVPGGHILVAFLDAATKLGQGYVSRAAESPFYRDASFRSSNEVLECLSGAGFREPRSVQTIFEPPGTMSQIDCVLEGTGTGLFAVIRARRPVEKGE